MPDDDAGCRVTNGWCRSGERSVAHDTETWNVFQNLLSQLSHEDDIFIGRTNWLIFTELSLFFFYIYSMKFDDTRKLASTIVILGIASTVILFSGILASLKEY